MKIENKRQMYAHGIAGRLGNFSRIYSLDEVRELPATESVGIRSTIAGSSLFVAPLTPVEAFYRYRYYLACGARPADLRLSEAPDPERSTIQGEVWNGHGPLVFEYTFIALAMRFALQKQRLRAEGLTAHFLLRRFMDPVAFDCLFDLLDLYPGAVVEVSSFSGPVGRLGWNTMFWEVRNY